MANSASHLTSPEKKAATRDRKSTRLNSSHSLHDALPIWQCFSNVGANSPALGVSMRAAHGQLRVPPDLPGKESRHQRSEEHTSELQSLPTRRSSDLAVLFQRRGQFAGVGR